MMRARLFVVLFAAMAPAFARPALLVHVPLQWRPTSELRLGALQMSQAHIQFLVFQERPQQQGGHRRESRGRYAKARDNQRRRGRVRRSHIRELFDHEGLKTVDGDGDVTIKGEVTQFYVRETSTYKSEIGVRLTVTDRAGKTLWSGLASGDAERFGRSYKLENYYEVLSDALVNTVSSMLDSAQFQSALSGH